MTVRTGCKLASTLSELCSQEPRPLSLSELQRLHRLGFEVLAKQLAAGVCDQCGMNKAGTGHRQLCIEPERLRNPLPATEPPRQPWEPRPPSKRLPEAA